MNCPSSRIEHRPKASSSVGIFFIWATIAAPDFLAVA